LKIVFQILLSNTSDFTQKIQQMKYLFEMYLKYKIHLATDVGIQVYNVFYKVQKSVYLGLMARPVLTLLQAILLKLLSLFTACLTIVRCSDVASYWLYLNI